MSKERAKTKRKKPRGRPTVHDPDVADQILDLVSEGKSLRHACRIVKDAPPESTVRRWVVDDRDGFAARFARARALGLEALADETLEIADDGTGDEWIDSDGRERVNSDVIARSKLRVDTRKWLLSKLKPDVYGDSTKVEHQGKGGGPIEVRVTRTIVRADAGG